VPIASNAAAARANWPRGSTWLRHHGPFFRSPRLVAQDEGHNERHVPAADQMSWHCSFAPTGPIHRALICSRVICRSPPLGSTDTSAEHRSRWQSGVSQPLTMPSPDAYNFWAGDDIASHHDIQGDFRDTPVNNGNRQTQRKVIQSIVRIGCLQSFTEGLCN